MLKKVWIKGFRNLNEVLIDAGDAKTCFIYGKNNQGKTNFLEALYVLGNLKSVKGGKLLDCLNFNQQEAFIGADVESDNKINRIYIKFNRDGKRYILLNNQPIKKIADLKQLVAIDYISADIIKIFQESPDVRRDILDSFLKIYFSEFKGIYNKYERLISQKNKALKMRADIKIVELFNQQLIELAFKIVQFRLDGIVLLEQELNRVLIENNLSELTDLKIKYCFFSLDTINNTDNYPTILQQKMADNLEKEQLVGYSLAGPHRDDFVLEISTKNLFCFYSKGINRIMAILFKIAQLNLIRQKKDTCFPVLLLDDVFAEIDIYYKQKITKLLDNYGQIFYTSVISDDVNLFGKVKQYQMVNGVLEN
jgi:DNA replication and repair protein RecF